MGIFLRKSFAHSNSLLYAKNVAFIGILMLRYVIFTENERYLQKMRVEVDTLN